MQDGKRKTEYFILYIECEKSWIDLNSNILYTQDNWSDTWK